MKRRQSRHLHLELFIVGWKRVIILIQETRQDVVKLEVFHVAVLRRLEGLIATNVRQY